MKVTPSLILWIGCLLLMSPIHLSAQETAEPAASSGLTIHVVQSGENLFRIALRYGLTTQELAEINGISNTGFIQVGQRLLVPIDALSVDAPPPTHTIQPGESLNSIAARYGVTVETLMMLNDIANPNQIYAGQVLQLEASPSEPASTPGPTSEVPIETSEAATATPTQAGDTPLPPVEPALTSGDIHVVQVGETLFRIATSYGVSVNDLAAVNGITDPTRIFAGQQLIIPGMRSTATTEAALDLPPPIVSLDISPLIFVEGETGSVQVTTAQATSVTGTFFGNELPIISENGTRHTMLIGIPVFTDAGIYPVQLAFSNTDGTQTDFAFNVRVASGGYFTQNINVSADQASLLAPAVQETEINLIAGITRSITPQRAFDGPFSIPAPAAMNAPFGTRRSYNSGPVNTYHSGADFAAAPGTPILAAANGRVVLADTLNIRGNTVMIDHGWGVYTGYAHLTNINVAIGDTVTTGQLIGTAGSTGRVTGPHLHWEVWVNGVPVNPLQWTQRSFP